jgi:hypothetical protein
MRIRIRIRVDQFNLSCKLWIWIKMTKLIWTLSGSEDQYHCITDLGPVFLKWLSISRCQQKKVLFYIFGTYCRYIYRILVFKDNKVLRSHTTVEIKVFQKKFPCWWKDPEPHPRGGPKTYGSNWSGTLQNCIPVHEMIGHDDIMKMVFNIQHMKFQHKQKYA